MLANGGLSRGFQCAARMTARFSRGQTIREKPASVAVLTITSRLATGDAGMKSRFRIESGLPQFLSRHRHRPGSGSALDTAADTTAMTSASADRPLSPPQAAAGAPPIVSAAGRPWVPIRSLASRHRERILAHLVTLPERDRYLRFGFLATDEQLARYVDRIDFAHDEVFGIFNRRLVLIAMAHLAYPKSATAASTIADSVGEATMAEFGVSVLAQTRGRGLGRRLFEHAMLHARNRGVDTLFIHALSENTAMLKIARRAGAQVERHGSESEARLKLPPDTLSSHVGEMVEQQAAEFDYRFKRHVRQVTGLFGAFYGQEAPANDPPSAAVDD